jgi:hypothetical protein
LGTEFHSEKIPRNTLGTVSVIPRKKALIPRHSEFRGGANSEARNGTERNGIPRKRFVGVHVNEPPKKSTIATSPLFSFHSLCTFLLPSYEVHNTLLYHPSCRPDLETGIDAVIPPVTHSAPQPAAQRLCTYIRRRKSILSSLLFFQHKS